MNNVMEEKNIEEIKRKCRLNNVSYETYQSRISRGLTEEEALIGMLVTCKSCGAQFRTFAKTTRYCSDFCRTDARNLDNRKYRAKKKLQKQEGTENGDHKKSKIQKTYSDSGLRRDIERGEGDLEAIYNRPLTPDTQNLVNMWYKQGDSIEQIAYILRRPVSVIEGLIIDDSLYKNL